MASLAQIRNQVDAWLADKWPHIQARQTQYAANHNGRYFQGLITHSVLPSEGNESAPDRLTVKPHGQTESWNDAFTFPATFPAALKFDIYRGPAGHGYVATVFVRVVGTTYMRSQNVGPETWRNVAWRVVPPTTLP